MLSAFSSRLLPRGFQLISCDFLRQAIRERVFYSVGSEQMDDSDYTFRAATGRWPAFRNIARSLSPTQRLGRLSGLLIANVDVKHGGANIAKESATRICVRRAAFFPSPKNR